MDITTATLSIFYFAIFYLLVVLPCKNVINFWKIPSYETLPILGNVLDLWKFNEEFNKLYERWISTYGTGPTVVWGTYWFPIVLLGNANDVKKVLSSREHISKGVLYKALDLPIGTGAFNSPAEIWKQRRPHLEKAFHSKVLQQLPPVFEKSSRCLLAALKKNETVAAGELFDIHPFLNLCSIQMLIGGALGLDIDPFADSEFWELAVKTYNRGTYLAEYRMLRPWFLFSNILWNLNPLQKEMQNVVDWLHQELFLKLLKAKQELVQGWNTNNNDNDKINSEPKKFLDFVLHLQKTKKDLNLSELDLIYEMVSIYIAGTDASGKTMSFLLLFLGMHEAFQDKVVEELNSIFGEDDDGIRPVTEADCKKMVYLECCIKETLRLMPPVPFITRRAGSDIQLDNGGYIPEGTEVVISTYAVHRNANVYPEPTTFSPDRFLKTSKESEDSPRIGPYDWIPFSAGPRNCLGPKFAIQEIKVVAANILRHYKIVQEGSMDDWVLHTNITLDLEGGWNLRLMSKDKIPQHAKDK